MEKKVVCRCIYAFIASSILMTSCMNDVDLSNISDEIQIEESLVIPIGKASATIEQIIAQLDSTAVIYIEGDELLWEMKDSSVYELEQFYFLPLPKSLVVPINVDIPANGIFELPVNESLIARFGKNEGDENDIMIDSAYVNNISFNLKLEPVAFDFEQLTFDLSFPFPEVTSKDGGQVSASVSFSGFNEEKTVSFPDLKFNNPENTEGLTLVIEKITVKAKSSGATTILADSPINITFSIPVFDYKVAYGRFRLAVIETKENKFDLDYPENFNGTLKFLNPIIDVQVTNSSGINATYDIDYVRAYAKADPTNVIFADFNGSPSISFNINKVAKYGDIPAVTSERIDKDNGAIYKFFQNSPTPDVIEYKYTVSVKNSTTTASFITPDSKVNVVVKGKIPFHLGEGSYYEFNDSILNVGDDIKSALDDIEDITIDYALVRLTISNGLPINAIYEMEFLDDLGVSVDTLGTGIGTKYQLKLPTVNSDGRVTNAVEQVIDIKLTNDQIEKVLKKTNTIAYKVLLNGESGNVEHKLHLAPQDALSIKLGLFVKGKYTSKNN